MDTHINAKPIHPLLRDEADRPKLPTRPIERLIDAIRAALEDGRRGIHYSGRSGDGKSEAANILVLHRSWMPIPSPISRITIPHRSTTTDRKFYKFLQRELGLTQHPQSDATDRMNQIVDRMIQECVSMGSKYYFLIVDQAQLLHADDYHYLANIDDLLTLRGFRIFCIFVHQIDDQSPSSVTAAESLKKAEPNIGRRFNMAWHRFTGLAGLEDIADFLARIGRMRFGDKTYFEEFAPGIHASNGKLEDTAPLFVSARQSIRKEQGLNEDDNEMAMAIFEPAVVSLLTDTSAGNPDFKRFEEEHIKKALLRSGYVQLDLIRKRQLPKGGNLNIKITRGPRS